MHVKLILNIFQYMYLLILVMLILGVPPPTQTHTHNGILKMFVKAYALLNLHRKRV